MSKNIKLLLLFVLPLFWLGCIFLVLNITSPLAVGPAGILLLFGLVYVFVGNLLFVLTKIINMLLLKLTGKHFLSEKRLYYLVCVVSFGPIFLLALKTLGRLGFVELILVIILIALAGFYILRRSEV